MRLRRFKTLTIMQKYILPLLAILLCTACVKDELAFDIVESPVLGVFRARPGVASGRLGVEATFYELDKRGILDHRVGIDSLPVAGLEVEVFIYEKQLIGTYTTDAQGKIFFEAERAALQAAPRLEWTGRHRDIAFRIYQKI